MNLKVGMIRSMVDVYKYVVFIKILPHNKLTV